MPAKGMPVLRLAELVVGEEADIFALLYLKEELRTKDGKPYHKVGFRDATRELAFPIWHDSPHGEECRKSWHVGAYYKIRGTLRETNFGPQLDLRKVRETIEADAADGFDPDAFRPQSRFDPAAMFDELCALAEARIANLPLRRLSQPPVARARLRAADARDGARHPLASAHLRLSSRGGAARSALVASARFRESRNGA